VSITLGKDCSVSVGGTVTGARNVSFTSTAKTIDIDPYGARDFPVYSVGYDTTVVVEFNDSQSAGSIWSNLQSGSLISVSGGAGGWSFNAVVTGISETDPLDGVATFTVEAKLTRQGLR
jgi:hypothetical protein